VSIEPPAAGVALAIVTRLPPTGRMTVTTTTQTGAFAAESNHYAVDGNDLSLLFEGDARRDALLALIDGAAHELRLLYYIYSADAVGTQVRDALVAACGRGVTVALLIDGFGSDDTPTGFFDPLRAAGGSVCRFLPRFGRRYLLRNHQKLALADGRRVLIGGFNIDDSYFASVDDQGWRDLGLLLDGPAADHLTGYFDMIAAWARDPKAKMRTMTRGLNDWSQREGALRWLFGGPTKRLSPWARALRRDIATGKRLDMIAAYFAPNPGMLRRIGRLARRGTVRIMTASKSDNTMTIAAARNCYVRLLRRRARIWEYQPTKLHTKLFVVDDVAYVGSANCDMRSLYINCEIMLRIDDAGVAARLRTYAEAECGDAREASEDLIRRRSNIWTRFKWAIAYFVVSAVDYSVTRRVNFGRIGAEI
jgi:cardiolipin synthase